MKQQSENLQEIKGDADLTSRVFRSSDVNDGGTDARSGTQLTQPRSGPVRYELIDRFGMLRGRFDTAHDAILAAERIWPGEEQDPDHTGKGYDIQVVGS
jgi:hypothetical protein